MLEQIAMIDPMDTKRLKISLLTGGQDIHYALGLLSGLSPQDLDIEFIGNDNWQDAYVVKSKNVIYYNLRGDQTVGAPLKEKIVRVLRYYLKLIKYAAETDSKLFHIQWLNKFAYFDRTLLNVYYKILRKRIIFTAHDINFRKLVGKDSMFNRLTLRFMYRIVDHIIVHTEKMREELEIEFNINKEKISVIPFGINDVIPNTNLTRVEAKKKLSLENGEKIMLFFGNIAPYKGVENIIVALNQLKKGLNNIKLIVAGRVKQDCQLYWENIQKKIVDNNLGNHVIKRIEYIPEEEAEIYFKAADILILPYKHIFQSGVILTAYRFGLPVIATDVGSLKEDIIEGKTGFICRPDDPQDLAKKILLYYESDIFKNLEANRKELIQYSKEKYSWEKAGEKTYALYKKLSTYCN